MDDDDPPPDWWDVLQWSQRLRRLPLFTKAVYSRPNAGAVAVSWLASAQVATPTAIQILADPIPEMTDCIKMLPTSEGGPLKETCNVGYVTPAAQQLVAGIIRNAEERAAAARLLLAAELREHPQVDKRPEPLRAEGQLDKPARPHKLLTSWREITDALELQHADQDKVRSLNERFDGPIPKPRKGSQPIVRRDSLLSWWNQLALLQQEKANVRDGAELSVEAQHPYGNNGTAVPEIDGSIKNRRADTKR